MATSCWQSLTIEPLSNVSFDDRANAQIVLVADSPFDYAPIYLHATTTSTSVARSLPHQETFLKFYFFRYPLLSELLWNAIANNLNREIKEHDVKVLPFSELHLQEFKGCLELYLPTLKKIISRLYEKEMGVTPSEETRQDLEQAAAMLVNLLVEALRTAR